MIDQKQKIINVIMKSILIFPILTVLQGFSFLSNINKIWMGVLIFELLVSFKNLKYRKNDFFVLIVTIIIHIIAFLYTREKLYNINILFYLFIWIQFYLFCATQSKSIVFFLEKNKKFLKIIIYLWTFIVGISIFIPSCYSASGAFMSFADKPFRLMPTALVISALVLFLVNSEHNKKYYYFIIIPTYSAFMGSSRTYFIVFFIFILLNFYMWSKDKHLFFFKIIPVVLIILLLLSKSNIGEKMINKIYSNNTYYDFLGNLTSGRTVFWVLDLKAFNKLPFFQKFIGNGYNFVFYVNASHGYIWAHNDIINLLMNFGYIGVIIYIYSFFRMYNILTIEQKSIIIKCLFLIAVFINSMFNMSYTYLCAFISYPLYLIAYNEFHSSNNKKRGEE